VKRILSLVMLGVLLVAGCTRPPDGASAPSPSTPASQAPKRVTLAILGDLPSLYTEINPAGTTRGQELITASVNAGLAQRNDRDLLVPRLSEKVPDTENGLWKVLPDGRMETTWALRPNIFWHDGKPLTSQDVVFTLGLFRDKELPDFYAIAWDAVDGVSAPDARTVTVTWKRPYIDADELVGLRLLAPAHLLQQAYTDDKANFMQHSYWSSLDFIGAGPFRAREWVRTSHLVLEAFDQYVTGRPKLDQIEVKIIPDTNTLMANVLAGAVDATVGKTLSLEQALEVQSRWPDGHVDVAPAAGIGVHPQHLTPNPPLVANAEFRRALLHGIDRQQQVDVLLGGRSTVHHSIVPPSDQFYPVVESSIVRYDYDPRKSIQILDNLGLTRGSDGIYLDASGQRLQVELRTVAVDINQKSVLAIQNDWQQIGIASDTFVIPTQRAQDREYRSTFPGFELVRSGIDIGSLAALHSSNIATAENGYRGGTRTRYKNPEFDRLIEGYLGAISKTERGKILQNVVALMTRDVVHMGMFYDVNPTVISNRLVNVAAQTTQDASWNIDQWDVKS
jgi:peptide/nickel transport system substrate-binding protein